MYGDDLSNLPLIQHSDERVLTTDILARVYGVEPVRIRDNHAENRERFQEGVHFHKLTGGALRTFKNQIGNSDLVADRAAHLILWTARGAARHAKMLSTDAAWAVFGKLEDTYFLTHADGPRAAPPPSLSDSTGRVLASDFRALVDLGPLLGYDRNQAALAANRAVRHLRGIDLLSIMGATHLIAPQQERLLTPTDIGKELGGKSGLAINNLLSQHGLQAGKRDAKNRQWWEPTAAGEAFAVWLDTGKHHGDGTAVRQLKWTASIVNHLKALLSAGVA